MKAIFLDIDGVLNTENFIMIFFDVCKKLDKDFGEAKALRKSLLRDDYGNHFEPNCVQNLEWITKETGAKVIISSTWRFSGLQIMQEMFKSRNIDVEIIDITPNLDICKRGEEIKLYLENNPQIDSYVIIDDDTDMLEEQLGSFVNTDSYYGLTRKDAVKAIEILNNYGN